MKRSNLTPRCEIETGTCKPCVTCQHGGTNNPNDSCACQCPAGWGGPVCETDETCRKGFICTRGDPGCDMESLNCCAGFSFHCYGDGPGSGGAPADVDCYCAMCAWPSCSVG